eukprot:SAG11_NODE_428_length_9551_cov_6.526978_1_plen_368_part_10
MGRELVAAADAAVLRPTSSSASSSGSISGSGQIHASTAMEDRRIPSPGQSGAAGPAVHSRHPGPSTAALKALRRLARNPFEFVEHNVPAAGPGLLVQPSVTVHYSVSFGSWRYTYGDASLPSSIVVRRMLSSPVLTSPDSVASTSALLSRATARVSALRANLAAQGCAPAVVDQIVMHNWAASTGSNHDSAWHQWERHCAELLDDSRRDNPSHADLCNFLARVRRGDFSTKDVDTFSAEWVRKVRSTVSATVAMWQGRGMRVGEHPLVSSYIQSLTNDDYLHHDRRKYKYEDTWDVQPVFDYVHSVVESDAFSVRVQPLNSAMRSTLRSVVVPLARIILCCRSSDLTCIYRGQSSDVQCIRFTHDDDG